MKGREGKKDRREKRGKDERKKRKIGKKNTLFSPHLQKEGKLRSQQIMQSTQSVYSKASSLHIIESHHAFHIASSTLLKLPHHGLKSCHTTHVMKNSWIHHLGHLLIQFCHL